MSHVVLARKYRPRSFAQMVGQEHVVQALGNALTSGRLHHAYLFTGTRGIGKTTVSRILAKSLNCTGPDGTGGITAEPCGVCQACTEIDADRFIDYIELDAASNRGIDEVRDLIERATYKPSVGRYKVFMIDEAHQLTKEAFNALLKTLEEPPDYLKFVLATTDPERMLPTVLSRCLQFNLRPMAPETVRAHLQAVLEAEGVAADAGALRLLSKAARGSMRDALSLTDQAIAFGAGSLQEAGVRTMLGSVDRSHAATLVLALAQRDGPTVLATVDALRSAGLSASGTLDEMAALLQQMAVEQAVPGALDNSDPDTEGARALASEMPADETQLLYSIVLHGRAELSLVSDQHAALTMVLLRLLAFPPSGSVLAPAPRAAPLVATPTVARATAPARPVAAPSPVATPVQVTSAATPRLPPAPDAAARPAPPVAQPIAQPIAPPIAPPMAPAPVGKTTPPVAAATPPQAPASSSGRRPSPVDEGPPPWVTDEVPDEVAGEMADDGAQALPSEALPRPSSRAALRASAPSEAKPDGRAAQQPAPSRPAMAPSGPAAELRPTALGARWADTVRPLVAQGVLTALVRELAWQAELVALTPLADAAGAGPAAGHCWQLRVEREALRNPALRDKLAAALADALGQPAELDIQPGLATDSIARRDAAAREAAQRDAEHTIQHDPAVRALMAQFRTARIVPGSIQPVSPEA